METLIRVERDGDGVAVIPIFEGRARDARWFSTSQEAFDYVEKKFPGLQVKVWLPGKKKV